MYRCLKQILGIWILYQAIIIIPRGVIWYNYFRKIQALIIESKQQIETPQKYRNKFG